MKPLSWKYASVAILAICAASLIVPNPAFAKHGKKHYRSGITVQSGYANGTVHTSVRYHRGSKQVRGPGGTWVSCFGGCDNAYREEFLDFWETIQENSE